LLGCLSFFLNKAKILIMSGGDWKIMFRAIQDGDYELVKYYLQIGIDPNYQHPEYMASPLVESIRYKNIKITNLLLEYNADPEIKEVDGGDTPMIVARRLQLQEFIALLNVYNS
jgi:hypothetical protein